MEDEDSWSGGWSKGLDLWNDTRAPWPGLLNLPELTFKDCPSVDKQGSCPFLFPKVHIQLIEDGGGHVVSGARGEPSAVFSLSLERENGFSVPL